MSLRKMPSMPALPGVSARSFGSDIMPSALSRWQPDIRAADSTTDNNVIPILGTIGQDFFGEGITDRRVSAALRAIGDQEVIVHLNSPGGDFFQGLSIYNLLREHKQRVTIKVLGLAASAASIVAMAGDRLEVPRAGFLMVHNTWVLAAGDRNDLRSFADTLEPFDLSAAEVYSARSGLDLKEVQKMMDRETWIGGQAAVDKGFADALLPADEVSKDTKAFGESNVHALLRDLERDIVKSGRSRKEAQQRIAALTSLLTGTGDPAEDAMRDSGVNPDLMAALAGISIR